MGGEEFFSGAEEWDENALHTTTSVMTCSVTIEANKAFLVVDTRLEMKF